MLMQIFLNFEILNYENRFFECNNFPTIQNIEFANAISKQILLVSNDLFRNIFIVTQLKFLLKLSKLITIISICRTSALTYVERLHQHMSNICISICRTSALAYVEHLHQHMSNICISICRTSALAYVEHLHQHMSN